MKTYAWGHMSNITQFTIYRILKKWAYLLSAAPWASQIPGCPAGVESITFQKVGELGIGGGKSHRIKIPRRKIRQEQRWLGRGKIPRWCPQNPFLSPQSFPPGCWLRGVLWYHLVARGHHNSRHGEQKPVEAWHSGLPSPPWEMLCSLRTSDLDLDNRNLGTPLKPTQLQGRPGHVFSLAASSLLALHQAQGWASPG